MKKLVSVLFALLLVGSFAFAQDAEEAEEPKVNVGSWSRIIFVPALSVDGGDNVAITGPSWAKGARVGIGFSATSEKAGMNLDLHSNGNNFGVGDEAKIWVAPISMLKIQVGKIHEDTLRGKFDDSDTLNAVAGFTGVPGKDAYFTRFQPNGGMVVSLTPAEGVFLGAALDAGEFGVADATEDKDHKDRTVQTTLTEDMIKAIQIGGGYVIPNIGHARVQYIGGGDDAAKWLEAAFAFTAVEGVLVDAGLKFNTEADAAQNQFNVAGSYTMDALFALVRANVKFGTKDVVGATDNTDVIGYGASADLSYTVADPVTVGLEASFQKQDDPMMFNVLPYVKIASGKGSLKTGFLFESLNDEASATGSAYTSWAIPIVVTVGF